MSTKSRCRHARSSRCGSRGARWTRRLIRSATDFNQSSLLQLADQSQEVLGALLLGGYRDGKLYYVGKVGTGFSESTLAELFKTFRPLVRARSALVDPPREKGITISRPDS